MINCGCIPLLDDAVASQPRIKDHATSLSLKASNQGQTLTTPEKQEGKWIRYQYQHAVLNKLSTQISFYSDDKKAKNVILPRNTFFLCNLSELLQSQTCAYMYIQFWCIVAVLFLSLCDSRSHTNQGQLLFVHKGTL